MPRFQVGQLVHIKKFDDLIVEVEEVIVLDGGSRVAYDVGIYSEYWDDSWMQPFYEEDLESLPDGVRVYLCEVNFDDDISYYAIGETAAKAKTWLVKFLNGAWSGWSCEYDVNYSVIKSCRLAN